jgi:hypothetical protein
MWSDKVRQNPRTRRSVENEVQDDIVPLTPQMDDLSQQSKPVRLEDQEIVYKWVLPDDFRVGFARKNVKPDVGIFQL